MKSILLHVYDDDAFESRFQAAMDLARAFEGHVTCLHATPFEDYLRVDPWIAARLPEDFSEKMKSLRRALQEKIEQRLMAEGTAWDWVHLNEPMSDALVQFSMLSDITVVTRSGLALERDEPRPVAGAVATRSHTPVLAVPEAWRSFDPGAPALLAWNGKPEAAAAMRASVPLLRRASRVFILEVEETPGPYPRDLAARYLSRHDVHAEIVCTPPDGSVAETILSAAREREAALIVMGAYGHSPFHEAFLGGVTRELLRHSPLPLLLAH